MTLYNCKHAGDEYRISKFDQHMNVESSYLCNMSECNCPAGVRPSCRHRQMLPKFIQRKAIDSDWMYDFDRGGWVQIALSEGGLDSDAADLGSTNGESYGAGPMLAALPLMEAENDDTRRENAERELAAPAGGLPAPTPTFRRRL